MDLDQLQSVRDRERQTDRLQQLREDFYEEAAAFVQELRAERDEAAAAADDPFDAPRVTRLTDRIRTAEQTLEAIYEKRVGKVVKAATFAAADLPAEAEGMTREEADLFDTLVDEIEENRATVLGRLGDDSGADVFADGTSAAGDGDASTHVASSDEPEGVSAGGDVDEPADESTGEAGGIDAAEIMGGDSGDEMSGAAEDTPTPPEPPDDPPPGTDASESPDGGVAASESSDGGVAASDGTVDAAADVTADAPESDVERELVRITDDVGPILGVDEREYDLAADDVVTLPAENARPLVERGVAERLEEQ